jgi:signal peptidase II
MVSEIRSRLPYILLVAFILVLDRWSKSMIRTRFDLNESLPIIDGVFNITYVRNTGVAFGIFSSMNSPLKAILLSLFSAAAVVFVVVFSLRSSPTNRWLQLALALIFAGALGNLYDRISYGYVVDFLQVFIRNYEWPSFNVADSAISCGVFLLAIEILRNETVDGTG